MIENLADSLRLLLVTDDDLLERGDPVDICRRAVEGGVTSVQLRLKRATDRHLVDIATRLRRALTVPLFINDRLDVAMVAGADGVHLGADDLAPRLARRLVPRGFVIGASVGDAIEASRAVDADYWGIGPLHQTRTKADAGPALGARGAGELRALAGARPCVVIGGIVPADVMWAREAGFSGVAVASGILAAPDPAHAARNYVS